jgi:hypothetical protein
MIAVPQRQLFDEESGQAGDCWKCCIASILELDYDEVPHFVQLEQDGQVESYWNATIDWLRRRRLAVARFGLWGTEKPFLLFGSQKIAYHFNAPGHWIASVTSLRIDREGNNIEHVVVMNGSSVIWDPHPLREQGHLGFREAHLLVHA